MPCMCNSFSLLFILTLISILNFENSLNSSYQTDSSCDSKQLSCPHHTAVQVGGPSPALSKCNTFHHFLNTNYHTGTDQDSSSYSFKLHPLYSSSFLYILTVPAFSCCWFTCTHMHTAVGPRGEIVNTPAIPCCL